MCANLAYFNNLTINPSLVGTNQFVQGNWFYGLSFGGGTRFVSSGDYQAGGNNPVLRTTIGADFGSVQLTDDYSSITGNVLAGAWQGPAGNGTATLNVPVNGPITLALSDGYSGNLPNWGVDYTLSTGLRYNFQTRSNQATFNFKVTRGTLFFQIGTALAPGGAGTYSRSLNPDVSFQFGIGTGN